MSFLQPYSEEQFEALIHEKLPLLRSLAMRILHNPADADDAVQNALVKGWSRRLLLRTPEKLAGWVSRIVVNESYNLLRGRIRERAMPLEQPLPETAAHQNDDGAHEAELQRLENAIAALPPLYRQTIHIAVLSDIDTSAAAQMMGCNANTLYQRIHKAKELLRKALENE